MKKLKKTKIIVSTLTVLALVVPLAMGNSIQTAQAGDDSRISAVAVATGYSKTAGATTSYTVTFTVPSGHPINVGTSVSLRFQGSGCPWDIDWMQCQFDLENATVATGSFTIADQWSEGSEGIGFAANAKLSAGSYTVTISNVGNPAVIGGLYQIFGSTRVQDDPPEEGVEQPMTPSNALLLGNVIVTGTVYDTDGTTPMQNVWVQLHSNDWSVDFGSNTNSNGQYALIGALANGTYTMEAHAPWENTDVLSPDPKTVNYSGTTLTSNFAMIAPVKTIKAYVKYNNGVPCTSARVNANKRDGGGGSGARVDANGLAQFSVSGGNWELRPECGWDPENNQPLNCNWAFNQPGQQVSFTNDSSTETKTVNLTVQQTNAKIKGTVKLPNGTLLSNGFVDIRSGGPDGGGGNGSGLWNGAFDANVMAGNYKVSVHPDDQNPDLARYYSDEVDVNVGVGETKTLNITMKQKTSKITGTVKNKTTGAGVEGVWLNTWKREGQGWSNTQSGANGAFTFWVSAGDWEFNVDTHRRDENQATTYIPADSKMHSVSVGNNETVSGMVINVQEADANISVKAVDKNGAAITEDTWGWAFCRKKGQGWGPGNEFGSGMQQGTANIPLIGGFTYICGMHNPPDSPFLLEEDKEVTVAAGQTAQVNLTLLEPDSAIIGWVKDQQGNIVKNMGNQAEVFAVEAGGNWEWRPGRLNDDGSYEVNLLGGPDKIYMVGFRVWGMEKGESEFVETHPEPDDSIRVPANSEVTKIITAFRADTYISGQVLDPSGNPMGNVWVGADNHQAMEGKIKGDFEGGKVFNTGTGTRPDGTFKLNIVSGTFNLYSGTPPEFQNDFMSPRERQVTVTSASPAEGIVMQYRQADAFITAAATLPSGSSPMFGWCHAWNPEGGHSGRDIFDGQPARIPLTAGTWFVGCDTMDPETNKFYRSEEQRVSVATGDDKSLSFSMTEESYTIPEPFSQTFTASQLNVFTLPDGTTVTLPANAAGSEEGNYQFMGTPGTNFWITEDSEPAWYTWDLEILDPNNQVAEQLQSNATICMPLKQDVMDEKSLTVDDIFPKYWDTTASAWKTPESAIINEAEGQACLQVSHFTEFALTTQASLAGAGGTSGPADILATPASGGGPQIIIANEDGSTVSNFFAYDSGLRIGLTAATADVDADGETEIVVAPGAGAGPQVRIFDHQGNVERQFFAYPEHIRSGIYVTTGDVNGDGTDDIITSTREGAGPQVAVFDSDGNTISRFFAYAETYRNGFSVTTGDVNGDGSDEIVVVPDGSAGPQVRVFDYQGNELASFFAYGDTVRGGYNATTGDVNGDGVADIVITPKAGLGPQVAMFTGTGTLIDRFFAYAESFRGGINVSVGDTDGDGNNDIVACPESGAGPQIRVFDTDGSAKSQFWAYASTLRGKFTSFVADLNGDGTNEVVTAPGEGMGPQVRTFDRNGNPLSQFFTHHTGFRGGLNMFPAY
ncbi:MAG: FG-GAP-like repeat-containing protein [Patescibacteria group bacterium]